MGSKFPSSVTGRDLISLVDSPRCPTAVLIDLTDAIQVPFPQQLLQIGEFDDTFGIYGAKDVSKPTAEVNPSGSKKSIPSCISGTDDADDAAATTLRKTDGVIQILDKQEEEECPLISKLLGFESPPKDKLTAPGGLSAVKLAQIQSASTPPRCNQSPYKFQGSPGGFSDSDSILDIANLSTFSVSDTEEVFDELESNGVLNPCGISPSTMSKEIKELVAAERAITAPDTQRRESVTSFYNRPRLSSAPADTSCPVSFNLSPVSNLLTSSNAYFQPIPMMSVAVPNFTTPVSRTPSSVFKPRNVFTSPRSRPSLVEPSSATYFNTPSTQDQASSSRRFTPSSDFKMGASSSSKFQKPVPPDFNVVVSVLENESGIGDSESDMMARIGRLSFSSTSSLVSNSPTRSEKQPDLFGVRKLDYLPGGINVNSKSKFPTRPIQQPRGPKSQETRGRPAPLKATLPFPSGMNVPVQLPATKESLSVSMSVANTTLRGCPSAPVTRKFERSASPNPVQANGGNAPTKKRHSFNNVRSSGYGQKSPNPNTTLAKKSSAASPLQLVRKLAPTTPPANHELKKPTPVTPKFSFKGETNVSFNKASRPAAMSARDWGSTKLQKMDTSISATASGVVRRLDGSSKENNQPSKSSFLPRPGRGIGGSRK